MRSVEELLAQISAQPYSDVHLVSGQLPVLRVHGDLQTMASAERVSAQGLADFRNRVLQPSQLSHYEAVGDADAGMTLGAQRFRLNFFKASSGDGCALRRLSDDIPSMEALRLPQILRASLDIGMGLVLVTGPTGSGKTTTLASLLDQVNRTRPLHILTLEDPIEYLHPSQRALVLQRQVGIDTIFDARSCGAGQGVQLFHRPGRCTALLGKLGMTQHINLLQQRGRPMGSALAALAVLLALLLGLLLYGVVLLSQVSALRKHVDASAQALQQTRAALIALGAGAPAVSGAASTSAEIEQLKARLALVKRWADLAGNDSLGTPKGYVRHFSTLAGVSEDGLWLTHIFISDGGKLVNLGGRALRNQAVLHYAKKLNQAFGTQGVQFNSVEMTPESSLIGGQNTGGQEGGSSLRSVNFRLF